jgi:hypothetical protein
MADNGAYAIADAIKELAQAIIEAAEINAATAKEGMQLVADQAEKSRELLERDL